MAVQVKPKLDAERLRADFPIFEQCFHGKPLVYLDSAASSQKPRQMLEAMTDFYSTSYANVHRGVYVLAERATAALEAAREKVRAAVNAPDVREIVFVRNATEAINLVAYSWGMSNLGPGDVVVVSELEHHSNFVPWQYIAKRMGASLTMIPLTEEGELDLSALDGIAAHEHELAAYALGRLAEIPGITLYGPPADRRAGIVSFNIDGIHPHDVAQILDMQGVAIRAGHHCCQPLMQKLGVAATNRASFYLYTVQDEIDQLVDGLHTVHKVFA